LGEYGWKEIDNRFVLILALVSPGRNIRNDVATFQVNRLIFSLISDFSVGRAGNPALVTAAFTKRIVHQRPIGYGFIPPLLHLVRVFPPVKIQEDFNGVSLQ
jgi:hypothetical protein